MKKLIFCLSLIFILQSVSADVIYLNEGEEHVGTLKSIKDEEICFQKLNSTDIATFSTKDVTHILISKNREGDEINSVASITEPVAKQVLQSLPDLEQFKDSDYITLYRHNNVEFISENEVVYKSREIVQILKEPGLENGNKSFYYNHENSDFLINFAHTYSTTGAVYHLTDDALSIETLFNTTPEYARFSKVKFAMKKVDIGSIIDYSVTQKHKDISFLNPYSLDAIFGEREPVLHEEFTVSFPDSVKLKKVEMQWENNVPKFTEKTENNKTVWNWLFSDSEGFVSEQNMLPLSRIFPRVFIYQEYDRLKTAQLLASAYKEAEADADTLNDFLKKVEIKEDDTNYEKVCKVYNFINKEINIIGLGPGELGTYAPLSANITINKKYANQQAVLALMHSMLEKLGIKSYIGFTEGKREKITYKDYYTIDLASTPVLKVIIDNSSYYTDGGSIYTPFSVISTGIQGSNATFLDQDKKEFFDEVLPKQTFNWNTNDQLIHVVIKEDGSMDVTETTTYRGPYEESIRELKSVKEKEKAMYAERRVKSVHPKAVLKSYGFTDMSDLDSPAIYNLTYTIPEAAQKTSDTIMSFTNFWIDYGSGSASLKKRKYPMKYWATERTTKTIIFELPEGFNWVKWDKQYKHLSSDMSFSSNLNQTNRQLVYSDRFDANAEEYLTDEAYQNYRQCILTMSELANQWIILEK